MGRHCPSMITVNMNYMLCSTRFLLPNSLHGFCESLRVHPQLLFISQVGILSPRNSASNLESDPGLKVQAVPRRCNECSHL